MKTNKAAAIALALWFLFVAASVFAVFRPPYPPKPAAPIEISAMADWQGDDSVGQAIRAK
jgi:hypothetical protein